jgi:predicted phage baseplate assembly protein
MLMSRPLGLMGALNPQPATGGVDAEQRDEARQNAPLTVMTLDRIVSLRDYEDFARAFRGVAKALATWTWDGRQRGVFMTIAGADGAEILESSATYQNLVAAMRTAGDPYVPLRVQTYRKASFTLTARITRHPDYLAENVERAVRDMLAASFSFAARGFGQPVALSEVMAAIQQVAGVVAVDIDTLQRTDGIGGTGLVGLLPAARPQAGLGSVQPAELLVIDETNINLSLIE